MKVKIEKSTLCGDIYPPASKSMAHRLLICAALADGISEISKLTPCEDVLATVDCLSALGAKIEQVGDTYKIRGANPFNRHKEDEAFKCRESGSTLRFMIPLASLSGEETKIYGAPSLLRRPMGVYEKIFSERGLAFSQDGEKIVLNGALSAGEYTLRGDVSSQFITGLLFTLPLLDGDSTIKIIPPFESRSYIDLTLIAMREFGVCAEFTDPFTISVKGGQKYKSCNITTEADYSGAAFLDAFSALGSSVRVLGLSDSSAQGDRVYRELYPALKLGAPEINIENCPDLGPILFALAAAFNGAYFTGTARLRIKESDRAQTMAEELSKFGAKIEIGENFVRVNKSELHAPTEAILGHNDHRVVMSCAVLLTKFGGVIEGAEAVSKSYPNFFSDIESLGAKVTIYD